jgi:hypothetical protein
MVAGCSHRKLRENKKAVSPAVSMSILTSAIVVMLLITITFANNYLSARVAENEFKTMQQFMQTVGLQIDDVAWIIGRTQTLHYASTYGSVTLQSAALTYNFYSDGSLVASFNVSVILFNIPVSHYSIANGYFEMIFPSSPSFLQQNASAPVARVFTREKLPMPSGSYVRIVVAPIIRQLNSIVNNITYVRLYLPVLEDGGSPQLSQSVTLTGRNVNHTSISNFNNLTVSVGFPYGIGMGLSSDFFNFQRTSEHVNATAGSVADVYAGDVKVSLGAYS